MTGQTCGQKDALVSYLYDECDAAERARVEAHLGSCAECRAEVAEFRNVRAQLADWAPPNRELGFTIVPASPAAAAATRPSWRSPRVWLPAGLAAAAVLLLASAAAIANLDVRYGQDGLVIRTGWNHEVEQSGGQTVTQSSPAATPSKAMVTPSGSTATRSQSPALTPSTTPAVTQADLVALERRLKNEWAATSARPVRVVSAANASDDELLQRVQTLISESEHRQNRDLAVRLAQLVRDFDAQRQTDLVRIQNGIGALQGSTAADRQLLNYLVKVSRQQ